MMRSIASFFILVFSFQFGFAQIKVACVGNSVTFGHGIIDRQKNSYPSQLQQLLGGDFLVGNFGYSGATLLRKGHKPYINTEEYQRALSMKPDVLVIHLGLNDTDPRNWAQYGDEFRHDYFSLIDTFRAINPNVDIFICRMSPIMSNHWRFKSGTRDWYWLIQKEIEHIASFKETHLIDLQEPLYHRPDLLPDALHPDLEGTSIIANTIYKAISGNYGGLHLPIYYSDFMVLQRDRPISFSGIANRDNQIDIELFDVDHRKIVFARSVKAASNGIWSCVGDRLFKAGGNYRLIIRAGNQTERFEQVTFGDIWICSGQSNMAWSVAQSKDGKRFAEFFSKSNPRLRYFNMLPSVQTAATEWDTTRLKEVNQLKYYLPTKWSVADEVSTLQFSAIAASFGYDLSNELGVPIGLIHNAVGGSGIESWIDRRSIEHNAELVDMTNNWRKSDYIMEWSRGRASQNIAKSTNPMQRHPFQPCYLYESGVYPFRDLNFKGFIWYQGESNAHNIELHEMLFRTLVSSWRANLRFGKDAPFLYAQLSSIERPSWAKFRDSQRKLSTEIPNVAMVVTSDKGDSLDVHPREKRIIGSRFALAALNRVYGQDRVVYCGPTIRSVSNKDRFLIVSFDHAKGLTSSDGMPIRTFEVEASDGVFYPATAAILSGGRVRLTPARGLILTGKLRYGYQPYTRANMINGDGLPASTFCF